MARAPVLKQEALAFIAMDVGSLGILNGPGNRPNGASELLQAIHRRLTPHVGAGMLPLTDAQVVFEEIYQKYLRSTGVGEQAAHRSTSSSWRSTSGKYFQDFVSQFINDSLGTQGIQAVSAKELMQLDPGLIRFLQLPAKRRCVQSPIDVWPDNDIIVLARDQGGQLRALGIVSCKTSIRERAFESAFWALATRDTGLRTVFVTADLDNELGVCGGKSKSRQIIETYFDRGYSTSPRTACCAQIQPLGRVAADIRRWREDLLAQ